MSPLNRTDAPEFLTQHWEEWGKAWQAKLEANPKAQLSYPQVGKQGVETIRKELFDMSDDHCAFCDEFPVGSASDETIEHFKPKKKFPLIAYQWENLYPCCNKCQGKGDKFDDALLRPDADDYSFQRYFMVDWDTLEIKPNVTATPEDQHCANVTITLYKLNRVKACKSRMLTWKNLANWLQNNDIDDSPFRYLAEFLK